jgi:hypothetical protein
MLNRVPKAIEIERSLADFERVVAPQAVTA